MLKSGITAYLLFTVLSSSLLGWSLLTTAQKNEELKRSKVEKLLQNLAETSQGQNISDVKTSLATFLGNDVLLTVNNQAALKIHWQSRFAASGDSIVWTFVVGVPILILGCMISVPILQYRIVIVPQSNVISQLSKVKKTHQSLQMFAHDVRKPFSALKALLQILNKKSSNDTINDIRRKLLPEVDSLLAHVDGMINDLLKENDSNCLENSGQTISLDKVLVDAVSESAKKHTNSKLPISWNLQHSLKPKASEKTLTRCFSNLICNAIEAIGTQERLWIKSRDSKINSEQAISVTIGNSGKPISKDILAKLFTPFFTSGKVDGTGLGLAYVKNALEELNGNVVVRSDETRGTEFTLTIPAQPVLDKVTRVLPRNVNPNENQLSPMKKTDKNIRILVIEDQIIYFESLKAALNKENAIYDRHTLYHAKTHNEAIDLIDHIVFDLAICDIDLGSTEENGLGIVKHLKQKQENTKIYMYSNKNLTQEEQRFIELSTDGNIQKPADYQELNRIVAAIDNKNKMPVVAIIDDDCFVRELWGMQGDVIEAHMYESPEEFLSKMNDDPIFLDQFDAIIVDYYFSDESNFTGDQIAKLIKAKVKTPIIMASDVKSLPAESISVFDGQISKDCQSWEEVQKLMSACA